MNAPPTLNTLYFDNLRFSSMSSKKTKKEPKVKASHSTPAPPAYTSKPSSKNYEEAFASLQLQFGASGSAPCPAYTSKSKTSTK